MRIRFIAHAGMAFEEEGFRLLVDPWFFDSTYEFPVIESIGSDMKTIDFQIPKTGERIEDYTPDVVCVSHFHPHHSAQRDIVTLAAQAHKENKSMVLLHGVAHESASTHLATKVPPFVNRMQLLPGESIVVGPFTITACAHANPYHTAWHIKTRTGSALHIADGRIHEDKQSRALGDAWKKLENLSPDFLFISSGSHANRIVKDDGTRDIAENGIASPVEAVKIALAIKPKVVSLMGIYNHSIWKNRQEYILPAHLVEEQFEWALWMAPELRNVRLRPGMTMGIGDESLRTTCTFYLAK